MVGVPAFGARIWLDWLDLQILARFWPDFDQILRNTVVQYYCDGVIQFFITFSILTLVKTSQNRGKPCIKNPMYQKSHITTNPIYKKTSLYTEVNKCYITQRPKLTRDDDLFNPIAHPTRWIVYSTSCSGNLEGYFWGCLRLFRAIFEGSFGGVLEGF